MATWKGQNVKVQQSARQMCQFSGILSEPRVLWCGALMRVSLDSNFVQVLHLEDLHLTFSITVLKMVSECGILHSVLRLPASLMALVLWITDFFGIQQLELLPCSCSDAIQ